MTDATLGVAVGAGVATFFSPCAYALLPGYVGYYVSNAETGGPSLEGAVVRGVAAVVGVLAVFTTLGVIAAAVGETLQPIFPALELTVGAVLLVFGGLLVADWEVGLTVRLPERRASVLGFAGFGALYALAAAGCVAPLFLAVIVQSLTLSPTGTLLVVCGYAGTFAALLLSATVATALGHDLAASTVAPYATVASRLAGVVVLLAGASQILIAVQ